MNLVKYAGVSLLAMSASMANAGGMEATALSAGFMFEDGSYGGVSIQSQTPSLKATVGGVSATEIVKEASISAASLILIGQTNLALRQTSTQGILNIDALGGMVTRITGTVQ